MATEIRKVLGQLDIPVTTLTAAYTVPALTQAVLSSIVICNRTGSPINTRVSIAVAGAADDPKQYIYYQLGIPGNETFIATVGITLGSGDVVRGYADATGIALSLYGVEIT